LSMNELAARIAEEMIEREDLGIEVRKVNGATVIDAGVKAKGGFEAGIYLAKITLGGLANVSISYGSYGYLNLPQVEVYTDHPMEALMASQFAGWKVKVGDYFAMGSGPARALARKPSKLYEEMGYEESSDVAVLALETSELPNEEVISYIADKCGVRPENLYVIAAATNSLAGSVQISARSVETGVHKLHTLGVNPRDVIAGSGRAPIAPIHPDPMIMLGRTNDMLLYGAEVFLFVDMEYERLRELIEKAPSCSSKDYGVSVAEKVKEIGQEFLYQVDPGFFAPARYVACSPSGECVESGKLNPDIISISIGLGRRR